MLRGAWGWNVSSLPLDTVNPESGNEQAQIRKMAGFTYFALDGGSVVQVSSQDFVPNSDEALPLAEASVLTFQKP